MFYVRSWADVTRAGSERGSFQKVWPWHRLPWWMVECGSAHACGVPSMAALCLCLITAVNFYHIWKPVPHAHCPQHKTKSARSLHSPHITELLIPALVLLTPSAYGKWFLQDLAVLALPHIPLNLHQKGKKKKQNYSASKSNITTFQRWKSILSINPSKSHLFNAKRSEVCQDIFIFQAKSSKKK